MTLLSLGSVVALLAIGTASAPAGAQTTTTTTTTSTASAAGCPVLSLGNPNPGDLLPTGGYVVQGVAFDPNATNGAGVERVDLFLGSRDLGGIPLGSAVPGANTAQPRTFEIEVDLPAVNRGEDFWAYAYSSVSGAVTSVAVPVEVGNIPTPEPRVAGATPTPLPVEQTFSSGCTTAASQAVAPAGTAASSASPVASAPASQASAPAPAVSVARAPVLSLANPSQNDLLLRGGYVVSGIAYDPSSTNGPGIERVEFFIDPRDVGGTPLGSVAVGTAPGGDPRAFETELTIPNGINGGHDFVAYAISSTGQETMVSVPVFVGAPPTPTPHT